jgi:hypothetical protein
VEADKNHLQDKIAHLKRDLRMKDEETEACGKNGDLCKPIAGIRGKGEKVCCEEGELSN